MTVTGSSELLFSTLCHRPQSSNPLP